MKAKSTSKFELDGIPPLKEAIPLGLQHLMAMVIGSCLPAILVANAAGLNHKMSTLLIQAALIFAGLSTLLQLYPIPLFKGFKLGGGIPVIMGATAMFIGAGVSVAGKYGLPVLFGSQIVAGIVIIIIGFGLKKIRFIFTPVVSGTIVACMGLGLFPIAIKNLAGGMGNETFGQPINFIVGIAVSLMILGLNKYGKGLFKDASILVSIVFGYILSLILGIVNFSSIQEFTLVALPKPLAFGLDIKLEVVVMFSIIYLVEIADIMGACTLSTVGGLNRQVTDEELSSAVLGNGVLSTIGALFSATPMGMFGQNSAIVSNTKIISKFVLAIGGIGLFLAGVSPLLANLIRTIPPCVVGGATLVIFSTLTTSGLRLVSMDGFNQENSMILGLSMATGIGFMVVPQVLEKSPKFIETLLADSSVVSGAMVAIIVQGLYMIKFSKGKDNKNKKENI
ncbi:MULTISPECIES: uracil-xanthine permease family protein [unclassified Clostridioides]|uniref:uracil-xanthine permease family protein n=1 Tax=unclassified Clostridioides TaxID=2635829 RepID=UPI001D121652|nr:purine/pyrimidine permease [Clostridioides sp. ES-S-0049-03]MCC0655110.1 purine/pyrimidine permease [Clostridioides sp. ES-S-0123-01]MCC0675114.1 purine/pyrimidine permease [Clostridioides sp. ES-W-0018-02]MCC0679725.1 purine/pyrimidine permease [Clostridioides sp. ES-S-0005-03]MCC0702182.1 purine/pyrimidine permease [Clostridioides sp. ES-S-0049-02]MCC0707964.1 purine/pyrimidine permease [Clostridioides sp. ES-S-0190-01]MCC0710075.1 purine/pyrimidine permease [Clostridioides sp. ES-W-0017